MKVPGKTATGALLIAFLVVCFVFAVVAWSALDRSGGARSAGPVPGLPEIHEKGSPNDSETVHLPPAGSAPSAPEHGERLITLGARPGTGFPASFVPVHQVWVYADGRVISRQEGGPNGATGYLERRLTPKGVELLHSEVLSTGLFDRDGFYSSEQGLSWGEIDARNGDRLVSVVWCCPALNPPVELHGGLPDLDPTPRQARSLIELSDGLADLTSWLPASAWEEPKVTGFVPFRYAICYRGMMTRGIGGASLEPSRALGMLPWAAGDLLRGKDRRYDVLSTPLLDKSESPQHAPCSEVTTEDARTLEGILSQAGFEPSRDLPSLAPTYRTKARDPIGELSVSFEPILPHGRWEAMGG